MPEGRILVTGASGFIGNALVSWLLRHGRSVRAAVRTPEKRGSFVDGDCEVVVVGDIDSTTDWTRALEGIDVVVHLAGRAHVLDETSSDPLREFRATNVDGTVRLAEQATRGARRLVFVSSIGVNGTRTIGAPFSESSPACPTENYAISKHEAELRLAELARRTGLEVVVVRPPLVYGPRCPGNFLRLIRLVDSGIPLPLASIRNVRSFIHVDNLASALLACASHPAAAAKTWLVDDGEATSTPELARMLARLLGRNTLVFPCPVHVLCWIGRLTGRGDSIARLVDSLEVDGSAIRRELSWKPHVDLSQGLAETVRWYRGANRETTAATTPC